MATNNGIRISRDDLTRAITIFANQVPDATLAGMEDAVEAGAREMLRVAEKVAVTVTGRNRHPGTPGRHETGALVEEIVDSLTGEAGGAIYRIRRNRGNNLSIEFGFLEPETLTGHSGNPYIAAQELGTGGGGSGAGRGHGIPAMHAVQAGFNVAASRIQQDVARQLAQLGRDAEAGRLFQRAARQAVAK